jgi:hypothetical protein
LDVYVSNRNTGNETDSISHFRVISPELGGSVSLEFTDSIPSGGLVPRMFSLSGDESLLFSTNQNGDFGLLALTRTSQAAIEGGFVVASIEAQVLQAGSLTAAPVAAVDNVIFGDANFGPQFAMQI